jgi:hypothetical protein
MTADVATVNPSLLTACERVWVAPGKTTAAIGDREIEADTPRELRRLLAEALYEELHSGQQVTGRRLPFRLRDPDFERALAAAVPHRHSTASAIVRPRPDGVGRRSAVLVERDGVRVWVSPEAIRDNAEPSPGERVRLTVPAVRPALSPGFFLVDGSRQRTAGSETLRVYIHIAQPRFAAGIWSQALSHLEEREVVYRSKILSTKLLYPRRDALVVYLGGEHRRDVAAELAETVRHAPGVGRETSVFTTTLAPGIAMACEPDDRRKVLGGLSFGQHRATVLAHALVECAEEPSARETAIRKHFSEAGIDLADPALNTGTTVL